MTSCEKFGHVVEYVLELGVSRARSLVLRCGTRQAWWIAEALGFASPARSAKEWICKSQSSGSGTPRPLNSPVLDRHGAFNMTFSLHQALTWAFDMRVEVAADRSP